MFCLLLLWVSVGECIDSDKLDLVTPLKQYGESCGYESCPKPVHGMLNVHIAPHTHAELGHSGTFYQHYTGYDDFYDRSNVNMKRILDFTISELWAHEDRNEEFSVFFLTFHPELFTLSDISYFFHWWGNRDETVRRMVYQLLRQGRLHLVGGGWSMPDEATTSYHALIDQFTYSLRKLNATFMECARPLVSWQADSFAHSREFASLAAQMGFDGHFINPISYDDELRRMRDKSLEMVWRGSDDLGADTDIFTHKLFDGYWAPPGFCFGNLCNDPLFVTSDSQFRNAEERANVFIESMLQRQGPHYGTNNLLVMMGKRLGYYDAPTWFVNIDKLINTVNKVSVEKGSHVVLYYSSPACYLKAVHSSNPQLPLKQDDFMPLAYDKTSYFSGLFTSRPTIKYMAREGHVLLQMAKQLQVLARLPDNSKLFEEFNWITGVFQDHNIISGAMRPYVSNYYAKKMYVAVQKSTLLMKQAFNKLRRSPKGTMYFRCSFNISSCRITNGAKYFVMIYNPLSWPVSTPVRLPISLSKFTVLKPNLQKVDSAILKIPNSVMKIPKRHIKVDHELVFMAEDIPALGYRSYYIEKILPKPKRSIIKKINKNKSKKYLIRQTNMNLDGKSLLHDSDSYYDSYEDDDPMTSKIEFANITRNGPDIDNSNILTPKPHTVEISTETETEIPATITVDDNESEITTTTTKVTEVPKKQIREDELYELSSDKFISNKYIFISLDDSRQIVRIMLLNGLNIDLKIKFFYYASDDPEKMARPNDKPPGAYIFRPMDPNPIQIKDFTKVDVLKTNIVEELHTTFADYASFALKLYENQPTIEVDWVVGPIPVKNEIGKDVFIRYETNLDNKGIFYTDSNGRQTIKRIRNQRGDYVPMNAESIPGNYYPVTSKIYIEDLDKNIRFSIFNDRSQGGTSLNPGQIDLMVHRRILTDDSGAYTQLNETEHGAGIIVRGKHYLYVTKANYKPHKLFEKRFAKEIELAPQMLLSNRNPYFNHSQEIWQNSVNEFSGIKTKLPFGVHLLTLEEWNDGTLLMRLENFLEKSDTVIDGIRVVFLRDVFVSIKIKEVKETTLGANIWLKDWVPLQWAKKESFYKSFNDFYGGNNTDSSDATIKPYDAVNLDIGIKLSPQQIRTFVVWFDYDGVY